MSLPEVLLWTRLRGGQAGARVRRQHPIGPYVVDFCCIPARLVIEIDGFSHDCGVRPEQDVRHDDYLRSNGYRVIRFSAADVLADAVGVAASIAALVSHPLHRPADGPPPRAGEEQKDVP